VAGRRGGCGGPGTISLAVEAVLGLSCLGLQLVYAAFLGLLGVAKDLEAILPHPKPMRRLERLQYVR
jgi:hypothetical protein